MADQLSQDDVVVVFDQAIYSKALEIIWKKPIEFHRIVPCMGAFHIVCTLLAVIGKRFGDAGLRDVMLESGIIGSGSVNGVLDGRHYNRAMRIHKVIMEAVLRLRWVSFRTWLTEQDVHDSNDQRLASTIDVLREVLVAENLEQLVESDSFCYIYSLYSNFCQSLEAPMATFWNSYIDMVALILHFIRSTRLGNWSLHVACIRDMIPWMFAYDRTNYARYLPYYWSDMQQLETTHPIEQTINRATKTNGGIIGFSLNKGAVQRWVITAHERACIKDNCFQMADMRGYGTNVDHKESSSSRIRKDLVDVGKVMDVVQNFSNPYECTDDLSSLTSGVVASEAVATDLCDAYDKGRNAASSFIQTRLSTNDVSFYEPLRKLNLKTFTSLTRTKSVKVGNQNVVLKADRNLFARMIVVAQARNLDLREVLKHSLGPIPWSIAEVDGSFAKTKKSKMSEVLEKNVPPAERVPDDAVWIIDLMALLHTLSPSSGSFSDLASMVLDRVLIMSGRSERIDIVADQYLSQSIKSVERTRRQKGGKIVVRISSGAQKIPNQWSKFLSCDENKLSLVELFFQGMGEAYVCQQTCVPQHLFCSWSELP